MEFRELVSVKGACTKMPVDRIFQILINEIDEATESSEWESQTFNYFEQTQIALLLVKKYLKENIDSFTSFVEEYNSTKKWEYKEE